MQRFLVVIALAACALAWGSSEASSEDSSCVPCDVEPCKTTPCLDPNATCANNWCKCTAHWFRHEDGSTPQCGLCPDGTPPSPCAPPPCLHFWIGGVGCHAHPLGICYNDYCDGCWALYHDANGNKLNCSLCDDGTTPLTCDPAPCKSSTCAEAGAKCHNFYCNSCRAVWLRSDGTPAQCSPHPECPADQPYWDNCTNTTPPCSTSKCPGEPNATCTNNYCGGCHANWTRADGSAAQCIGTCPDGTNPQTCATSPCAESSCPADLSATCKDDGCGGCHAVWTTGNGTAASCACPPWAPESWCPLDLDICKFSWCPFEKNATCHMSKCGYPHPEWVKPDGSKAYCFIFF